MKERIMNKFALLTTTAIVAATLAFATPAKASEQGWFDSMKTKVQSWFNKDGQTEGTNAEVEAYLDQVTIAVPPMTGEEAAAIQPAAGDYVEDVQDEVNRIAPQPVAPGAMGWEPQKNSQINTEFEGQGSVTAFGDTPSADDLANIMPAAGDAEEITDESVVVVETPAVEAPVVTETVTETVVETTDGVVTEVEQVTTEVTTEAEEATTDAETGAVAE